MPEWLAAAILPLSPRHRNMCDVVDSFPIPPPADRSAAPAGYVFAGGGTGGHLYPAIALAAALREREPHVPILFLGTDRPQERELVGQAGYEHAGWPLIALGPGRRRPWAFVRTLWSACRNARQRLREQRPRVVIGCGGLASVPAVWGARREGIPIVLLEQNVLPGRATRWLSRWAETVCLSFEETRSRLPTRAAATMTGNPVRSAIAALVERRGTEEPSPLLLVLGGTLGSREINDGVLAGLASDPDPWRGWRIIHQTGRDDCDRVRGRYAELRLPARVEPFLEDLPHLLGAATIVITRAGGTTLAELACAARPTVVIPWRGAADDHQTHNARWYAERGAMLMEDAAHTSSNADDPAPPPPFWGAVERLRHDAELRQRLTRTLRGLARPQAVNAVIAALDATATR